MLFIVFAILLSVAALVAVAYPIFAKARSAEPAVSTAQETLDELLGQRDSAMQALAELGFDHRVGKITDEDFAVFEANLKQVAADSLRALDAWEVQADGNLDLILEREIAARRASLAGGRVCAQCGRLAAPDDRFCAACGAFLPVAEVSVCPRCGQPYEADDRFCAGCGQPLAQAPAGRT